MSVKHDMTCAEFKSVAAAYALGALDTAERVTCTHHLARRARHQGCFEAIEEARSAIDQLSAAVPSRAPRPEVWRAIEAKLTRAAPVPERRRRIRTPPLGTRARPRAHHDNSHSHGR